MTDRRSFLRGASVLMGHAALGQVMTAFAAAPRKATFFTDPEMGTLRALVDVILPATDSPAASAADTHYFIDLAMPACASVRGAEDLSRGARRSSGRNFATRSRPPSRLPLLKARAAADMELPYDQSFFKILKDYTLTGYFLSEIGATQALAYERVPGGFQGDLPLAAQPESVGDLMAATNHVRRHRRRLRHVGRLGRERTHARRVSRRWCSSAAATSATSPTTPPRSRIRGSCRTTIAPPTRIARRSPSSRRSIYTTSRPSSTSSTTCKHPYEQAQPFNWYRGYQVGGRSLMWARHVFRYSDLDFEANLREGVGIDWPIRYADIAPWYEHVERFIGASGENSGLPQLPEQILQPPFEMNALEKHIRARMDDEVRRRAQAHLQRHRGAVARAQWARALPGPQSMRARLSVQRVFLVERRDAAGRGGHRQSHAAARLPSCIR